MTIRPSPGEFAALAARATAVPVCGEMIADLETPVSAFLKLRNGPWNFLLESVEQEERVGRYTFVGTDPALVFSARGGTVEIVDTRTGERTSERTPDPLRVLRRIAAEYRQPPVAGLPDFLGGFIGYLSYDYVRCLERLPATLGEEVKAPDAFFMLARDLVVFDHFKRKLLIVANAFIPEHRSPEEAYRAALERIERTAGRLAGPAPAASVSPSPRREFRSNLSRAGFEKMVERCKKYIRAGDVVQTVVSHRWSKPCDTAPFSIYRALRSVNPSPYMFHLEAGPVTLVGSSPEILVRLEGRTATVRPIAGTRRRGRDGREDESLERELLADEKERAEHIMLVDLGRNDLGRVCAPGSVAVTRLMAVERYSHVMHIVSNVEGRLGAGMDAFDLVRACFPAGTVSGAPKVRAMEIIEELEPSRRGPYAGAVGYFTFRGDMDFCITIRTVAVAGGRIHLQAGAGIVADSVPSREYRETENKAASLMAACDLAREIPS